MMRTGERVVGALECRTMMIIAIYCMYAKCHTQRNYIELGWMCGSRGQEEKFKPRNAHARDLSSYTLLFSA